MMRITSSIIAILVLVAIFFGGQVASDKLLAHKAGASADLEVFLNAYFLSWSNNDMQDYRDCFHKAAKVIHVAQGQVDTTVGLDQFIKQQTRYLASLNDPVSEHMISFTTSEDFQGTTVIARWLYEDKDETYTGVNHFTLTRDARGAWKIITLVWYKDPQGVVEP
ncbi:MAG: hypothetical protein ACI96P_000452 [Candidatus Azotimanducaceae bacterium]|jgi:hypothetical protein